jgi:hypothetical protein
VNYVQLRETLKKQRSVIEERVKEFSRSHIVHAPLFNDDAFNNDNDGDGGDGSGGVRSLGASAPRDVCDIPGVVEAGWTPAAAAAVAAALGGGKGTTARTASSSKPTPLSDVRARLFAVLKGLKQSKDAWPFENPVDRKQVCYSYAPYVV